VKHFPIKCPSCEEALAVTNLRCGRCETEVGGLYPLPRLAQLSPDDHAFVIDFVKSSGSLKEMAKRLGVSYPTVRNRLNEIISRLEEKPEPKEEKP
jgi:hypothetical protein